MQFPTTLRAPLRRAALAATRAPLRNISVRPQAAQAFRKYSTEAPKPRASRSNNTGLYIGIGGAAAVAIGYYLFASPSDTSKEAGTAARSAFQAAKAKVNHVPTKADYQEVYNKIANILDAADYDDGSYGPILVRLAWHSSGTYDKETNTGGSNYATMRFAPESLHGANNGLNVARDLLQKIKEEYPWLSYGDLWTLAGVVGVQEMAGPRIPWRPGRIDGFAKDATPDGRLPDGSKGADHLRHIFYRMGFNDQEIVALSAAHAVGRCHVERSGFDGPWTFSPITFTNDFFKLLFDEKWVWRKWDGQKQLQDKSTRTLMMLPTDYVLVQDKSFKKWAKAYAEDKDLMFRDFAKAFSTLLELGVPTSQFASDPWEMKTLDEQEEE